MRLAGKGFTTLIVTSSITLTHILAAASDAALKQIYNMCINYSLRGTLQQISTKVV